MDKAERRDRSGSVVASFLDEELLMRSDSPARNDPEPLRPAAARLLEQLKAGDRPKRGRLTVYLGAAPGVGKTYAMLQAARRLKADGVDVVAGLIAATSAGVAPRACATRFTW